MMQTVIYSHSLALRAGLRSVLEGDKAIEVVKEIALPEELDDLEPVDVIIIANPHGHLQELASQITQEDSPPAMLFLTDHAEDLEGLELIDRGVWGVLPLEFSEEELNASLYALKEGLHVGSRVMLQAVMGLSPMIGIEGPPALIEELTPRESEVLDLLAEGLANKQIALRLDISEHTVKFHGSAIYGKLNVTNRTEAVRQAAKLGLLTL